MLDDVDAAFGHITAKLLDWEAAQSAATALEATQAAASAQAAYAAAHALAKRVASFAEEGGASPGVIADEVRPSKQAPPEAGAVFSPMGLNLPCLLSSPIATNPQVSSAAAADPVASLHVRAPLPSQ